MEQERFFFYLDDYVYKCFLLRNFKEMPFFYTIYYILSLFVLIWLANKKIILKDVSLY